MGRARGKNAMHAVATARRGEGAAEPYGIPNLKIQYDSDGESAGRFIILAPQKEAIDIWRNAIVGGERAILFYGPTGSGKSAMIEQLAAILCQPLVSFENAHDQTREVQLVSDNHSCFLELSREQMRALESLASPKVLAVKTDDPALQIVLADAVRLGASGTLKMIRTDSSEDDRVITIAGDTVIAFEVEGQGAEDSPCLQFAALADISPIALDELDEYIRDHVETDTPTAGDTWAQPQQVNTHYTHEEMETRPTEEAVALKSIIATLENADPQREALLTGLQQALGAVNEEVLGVKGRIFLERWLANAEIQAYKGDSRADRTLRGQLRAIFPAVQREDRQQSMALADELPSLQKYLDRLYVLDNVVV